MVIDISALSPELMMVLMLIGIWDAVWKFFALWRAGRNNDLWWFVCLAIFNTAGALPIVYLGFFANKKKAKNKKEEVQEKKSKKSSKKR